MGEATEQDAKRRKEDGGATATPATGVDFSKKAKGDDREAQGRHSHFWTDFVQVFRLAVCVAGIYVSYLTQGVLQENLSTKRFEPDGRRFEYLAFLNLAQSIICFAWSLIIFLFIRRSCGKQPPIYAYWSASVSNAVGPACGVIALKYISYPAQVLAKSSKMIPVMIIGALIYGVKYRISEYICTLLVAGGVSVFALYKGSAKALSKLAKPNAPLGYALCFLNLALDGFTNATQDSIKKRYPKMNAYHLMVGMNLWGSLYLAIYMFLVPGGGGYEALEFCRTHPEAGRDILWFCLCGALGQNFIFYTISKFGALVNTTITTTRKFVSILISALWNGNPLANPQWMGVSMVFSGLSYQIYLKWQRKRVKTE
ncbi:hypothetical protein CBR_g44614 [Chara braunii]|uniref:Sugar phosphate transporter domain-containing protein n=1 Tax=Chara braunii TaxID=69332 RepID=A0A388LXX1_CHABU|nr:hypothetical protein CBR_g44614 [Chara braunii]|eukprot:GBG87156.1 hypothetical protein CBR_g44614 [Chara braunii]